MRHAHRPLVHPASPAGEDYGTSEAERLAARHQHAILTRLANAAANGRVEEALAEADRLKGVHDVIQAHHRNRARDAEARRQANEALRNRAIESDVVVVGI